MAFVTNIRYGGKGFKFARIGKKKFQIQSAEVDQVGCSLWSNCVSENNLVFASRSSLGLGEIGPQDPNFKIKTCTPGF